jgi:NADH dehydrogenase
MKARFPIARVASAFRHADDVPEGARHRVVIVGGGFGGLPASRFLAHFPVDVTLIDRRNHHLFQPLLYQVATGILSPGQIAPPLRHILRRHRNVQVELAEVTGFDLDRKVVLGHRFPAEPFELSFDSLIVAAGADQSYFGHDEFALFAPGMKTIDDALEIRRRIFGAFEMAETATTDEERNRWMTSVIVGGGPTGVELAGQIRELAERSLRNEFHNIDPAQMRVLLVDAGEEPLATFGHNLSGRARKELEALGVELIMGARVINVDASGVTMQCGDETRHIDARVAVWAAGVQASPLAAELAKASGAELDRAGRIAVNPDLTVPGYPDVFAVGDMATLDHLPGVAEVAMQGSLHAASTITRRLRNDDREIAFTYRDLGSVATIGRFRAIFNYKKIRLSGFPAWTVWLVVHLAFLNGFANRFATLARWIRSMLGRSRAERVFSVAHTGGDLSTPAQQRGALGLKAFPALQDDQEDAGD